MWLSLVCWSFGVLFDARNYKTTKLCFKSCFCIIFSIFARESQSLLGKIPSTKAIYLLRIIWVLRSSAHPGSGRRAKKCNFSKYDNKGTEILVLMDERLKIFLLLHRMCCFHAKGSYMSQVNVNKKKKRSVPITPQNELPNGQFSVALFTYLEKKI